MLHVWFLKPIITIFFWSWHFQYVVCIGTKFSMTKPLQLFAYNPSKEICTFLFFLNYTSGYLKFSKMYILSLWNFFTNIFTLQLVFKKKFNFYKFAIFLQIPKAEHKSFPIMYHLPNKLFLKKVPYHCARILNEKTVSPATVVFKK